MVNKRTSSGKFKAFKDQPGAFADLITMEMDDDLAAAFKAGYAWKAGGKCIVGGDGSVE